MKTGKQYGDMNGSALVHRNGGNLAGKIDDMIITPLFAEETVETKMGTIHMSSGIALLSKTIREGYPRPDKTFLNLKYTLRVKPYILDIYLKTGQKEINKPLPGNGCHNRAKL